MLLLESHASANGSFLARAKESQKRGKHARFWATRHRAEQFKLSIEDIKRIYDAVGRVLDASDQREQNGAGGFLEAELHQITADHFEKFIEVRRHRIKDSDSGGTDSGSTSSDVSELTDRHPAQPQLESIENNT